MKKILPFLLAAVLCLTLVACGVKPPPATPPVQDPTPDDPPATTYEIAQKSVGVLIGRDASFRKYSFATAFVLTDDGKLVTNYSAVEHCSSAEFLVDGKTYAVTAVLAWDEAANLAVLQCDATDLAALPISATLPNVGDAILAFGSPVGDEPTFGEGTATEVSPEGVYHNALTENYTSGPILNAAGQVVGLHVARQSEASPCAIPITAIHTLSYGAPKTLQEVYALDHAVAFATLADWLQIKGTEQDGFLTYQHEGEMETYCVGYNETENLLRTEYFHFYESGDTYGFHLEYSPMNEQWHYWSDYHFAESEGVYADGTVNATEFTSKTALSMDSITMESQRKQLGALNTAAMKNLLQWFNNLLSFYANSDAADFGFLWHGKA